MASIAHVLCHPQPLSMHGTKTLGATTHDDLERAIMGPGQRSGPFPHTYTHTPMEDGSNLITGDDEWRIIGHKIWRR